MGLRYFVADWIISKDGFVFRYFAILLVLTFIAATNGAVAQDADKVEEQPQKPEIEQRHLNVAFETVFITRTTRAYGEVLPSRAAGKGAVDRAFS